MKPALRPYCPLSRPARTRCKIRVCVFARRFRHATCCATIARSLPLNELFFFLSSSFSPGLREPSAPGHPSWILMDGDSRTRGRIPADADPQEGRMRAEKIAAWGRINFRPVFLPALHPSFLCGFFRMYLRVLMCTSLSQRSDSLTFNNSLINQQKILRSRTACRGLVIPIKISELIKRSPTVKLSAISETCLFFYHFNVERARLPAIKGNNYRVISASSLCKTAVVKFLAFTMDKTTPGYFDLRT